MAGLGRCISKRAGRSTTPPRPLTDDTPQRSRAPARGPRSPHISITRAPGADCGLATSARDFTAASHLLTPRPGLLRLPSLSSPPPAPAPRSLSRDWPRVSLRPPQPRRLRPRQVLWQRAFLGARSVQARAPPLGEGTQPRFQVCPEAFSPGRRISHLVGPGMCPVT